MAAPAATPITIPVKNFRFNIMKGLLNLFQFICQDYGGISRFMILGFVDLFIHQWYKKSQNP
jgi:hypothetical protein